MTGNTYNNVVALELKGFTLDAFGTEPLSIDKRAVATFHVLDEYLDGK